jgi:hypothetical protein
LTGAVAPAPFQWGGHIYLSQPDFAIHKKQNILIKKAAGIMDMSAGNIDILSMLTAIEFCYSQSKKKYQAF